MSGHSKWSTIKRKKGAKDIKKGKIFSQLAKKITIAAKAGKNLDMAIAAARTANMPRDNIDRAIKRGTGEGDGVVIEELVYEAYAPGGIPILIKVLTDNANRSISELRALFNKTDVRLASAGSVMYLFDQKGVVEIDYRVNKEEMELLMIDLGFEDIVEEEDRLVGYCQADQLATIVSQAEAHGIKIFDARLDFVPKNLQPVENKEKLISILEQIEELEDVDAVYTNADL